jgi:hypothetical protein
MCRAWSKLSAAALLACAAAAAADTVQSSRSISLEIIVKFSHTSDVGRRVLETLEDNPQDLGRLGNLQHELQQSTGFVMIPVRITSGRELLLRVPEAPALDKLRRFVAKRPQIASAALIAIQEQNPRLAQSMLLVRFRPGSTERELLAKAHADDAHAAAVQALAAELCAGSGVPVLGSARADGALALELDRQALLKEIVERLNGLAEVDYAQPNAGVRIMN